MNPPALDSFNSLKSMSLRGLTQNQVTDRVQRELLSDMARGTPRLLMLGLAVAVLAAIALHRHSSSLLPYIWLAMMVLIAAARGLFVRMWLQREGQVDTEVMRWHRYLGALALMHGLAWGALVVMVPISDPALNFALALVVGMVMFGSGMAFGLSRQAYPLFVVPIVAGQFAAFILRPLPHALPIPVIWVCFGVAVVLFYRKLATRYTENILQRIAHESMTAEQRVLLDTLSLGVIVTHRRMILDCNDAFLRMFGYRRGQLVGQSTQLLMPGEDEFLKAAEENQAILKNGALIKQARRKRCDGSLIDVEINLATIDVGDPDSPLVGIYEDVTEQLRVEHELTISRERLRMALDAMQSGVWDCDTTEQHFFFSRRFKTILGYPPELRIDLEHGRLFFYHEFVQEEDQARIADARMDFLLQGEALDIQYRIRRGDRVIWLRETARAQNDVAGTPVRFTGSITDTTSINEIQEQLRASETLHRGLVEASNSLIWRSDENQVLTFVNERGAREMYGYTPDELIGRRLFDYVAPESIGSEMRARFDPLARGEAVQSVEMVHLAKNGRRIYVSVDAVPLQDDQGRPCGAMGINTDITHLKRRERAFQDAVRMQRLIFDSAGEGFVLVRNSRVYRTNHAFADLVGATVGDIVARPLAQWFEDSLEWEAVELQLSSHGNIIKVEQRLIRTDGRPLWVSVTGRVADLSEEERGYIWVFADISARKEQEEQSWHSANHDELTGLPNRRLLQDRFEQALVRAKREASGLAILMLDLDGFKEINDVYGHRLGDDVLKQVAQRLTEHVRQLDTVARLGGDEFVIVLHQIGVPSDAEVMAQRLIEEVNQPLLIGGHTVQVGTSVGIGMFPANGDGMASLLHAADMAMYAAKASGKNTYSHAQTSPRAGQKMDHKGQKGTLSG